MFENMTPEKVFLRFRKLNIVICVRQSPESRVSGWETLGVAEGRQEWLVTCERN